MSTRWLVATVVEATLRQAKIIVNGFQFILYSILIQNIYHQNVMKAFTLLRHAEIDEREGDILIEA